MLCTGMNEVAMKTLGPVKRKKGTYWNMVCDEVGGIPLKKHKTKSISGKRRKKYASYFKGIQRSFVTNSTV